MSDYCYKCELCHESGLSESEYCPWYGEPCGCNHPDRGIRKDATLLIDATIEVTRLHEALHALLEIVCEDCKAWYGDSREKCIGCPRVKAARAALAKVKEITDNAVKGIHS